MQNAAPAAEPLVRAGWSLDEWCRAVGFSVPKYYTVPMDLRPRSVRVGKRLIITESPSLYLDRITAAGGLPSRKAA